MNTRISDAAVEVALQAFIASDDTVQTDLRAALEAYEAHKAEQQGADARAQFEAWSLGNFKFVNLARYPDGEYRSACVRNDWNLWQAALATVQPSTVGQGDALKLLERYDWAVSALDGELNNGWDEGGCRAHLQSELDEVRAEVIAALAARQPEVE